MSRALLALVAIVAYAVVAFGWRSWLQVRRHGDTGLRLAPPPGSVARLSHLALLGSFALALAAPIAGLVAGEASAPAGIDSLVEGALGSVTLVAGVALVVVGAAITLVAQVQMGPSWRVGVDASETTELVTTGLFAVVRNPIFTSMLVGFAGLALLVPNALGLVGFALAVVALQLHVRVIEEPYLIASHGEPYRRWAGEVGRFLPGIGRLSPT